ncbi:DUF302 domain-containing protein [Amphibacillus cookii]|uniref:DUF302 domain-containing protein n=1 Tax=Amphibacillus cookii TaxID=767787 RepID=UPI00195E74E3|nr:DUF302 domain-containing protein [Amphibacillus cookii]MBM7540334.1 uncharacterized protein (DUF302 family) [Amphibacillus cookii]
MYDYTVTSKKTVEQIYQDLSNALPTINFGVLWELDLKATLVKKEIDHDEEGLILEVCNPKQAKRLIDDNPLALYFLPCKLVIYQVKGVTKVGMPRPTAQAQMIGDPQLERLAEDVERALTGVLDQVK